MNPTVQPDQQPSPYTSRPTGGPRKPFLVGLGLILVIAVVGLSVYALGLHNKSTQNPRIAATAPPAIAPAAVTITATGFLPAAIAVKSGQAVVWTNNTATAHSIIANSASSSGPHPGLPTFASSSLNEGDTYSYVFDTAGNYTYHDGTNAATIGTVVVR
jgi:plastocyanin